MSYQCALCGKPFATVADAELASINGCPECGSHYITLTPICEGNICRRPGE